MGVQQEVPAWLVAIQAEPCLRDVDNTGIGAEGWESLWDGLAHLDDFQRFVHEEKHGGAELVEGQCHGVSG